MRPPRFRPHRIILRAERPRIVVYGGMEATADNGGMASETPKPDTPTVAALADRYGPAILSFFVRRLSDRSEAEDLKQEVFVSLVRRSELHTIDNIEGYLFQVAANILRDRARRAGRRPHLVGESLTDPDRPPADEISPERIVLGREAYARFNEALQALPERSRTIFVLNRFEELSGREIAFRLGVSVSLVEKEMRRAIAFLKDRVS